MLDLIRNKKWLIVAGCLLVVLVSFVIVYYFNNNNEEVMVNSLVSIGPTTENVDKKYCDIKGNVKNPGVYEVIEGEVINDIIEKAGGLRKNSYVKNINLSKKVTDEMVINILSISEYEDLTYECPVCVCEEIKCQKVVTTRNVIQTTLNVFETTDVLTTTENTTSNILTTTKINSTTINTTTKLLELININTASVDELMTLSGIGKTLANRIIEYRKDNIFLKIEDIKNVKGIGDALFENIKEYIAV